MIAGTVMVASVGGVVRDSAGNWLGGFRAHCG